MQNINGMYVGYDIKITPNSMLRLQKLDIIDGLAEINEKISGKGHDMANVYFFTLLRDSTTNLQKKIITEALAALSYLGDKIDTQYDGLISSILGSTDDFPAWVGIRSTIAGAITDLHTFMRKSLTNPKKDGGFIADISNYVIIHFHDYLISRPQSEQLPLQLQLRLMRAHFSVTDLRYIAR